MTQSSSQPSVELADVFRMHAENYCKQHTLIPEQHKVVHAILNCRTEALGGHVYACDNCEHLQIAYNSCRNRHCPKCQSLRTSKWLEDRRKELLPVHYFHLVFTLPHELNHLISYNKKAMYDLLFQSAWKTLKTLGADPKRLDGLMGMLAVLHTWGQNLLSHNHLHCIVPGGALTDKLKWVPSKKNFLFPVKVISKLFRGFYVSGVRLLHKNNKLKLPNTQDINALLDKLMSKEWVTYAKEPFGGPEKLLDYLGRYTHKMAISNHRILACDKNSVTFKWRDYSDNNKVKVMKLQPDEFIRRFLSHVVPKGFMRIRFFGFLANACKAKNIKIIREQLAYEPPVQEKKSTQEIMLALTGTDISICPHCHKGQLHKQQSLQPKIGNFLFDTS